MSLDVAITLLLSLIDRAGAISAVITQAQAAGQTTLTDAQWTEILAADDAARKALTDAIATQGG